MKKRKFERSLSDEDAAKITANALKEFGIANLTSSHTESRITLIVPVTKPISVKQIHSLVQTAGLGVVAAEFDMRCNSLQLDLCGGGGEATGEEGKFTWTMRPAPSSSRKEGQTETEVRCESIKDYVTKYLGEATPAGVKLTVCDTKMQPTKDFTSGEEYRLVVTGWHTADLDQLEAIQAMFPFHVFEISVTPNHEVVIGLRGHLAPQRPFFRFFVRSTR